MPDFRLPLSGNVTQSINPWTVLFNPWGNQVGLININLGRSATPSVEEEVLTDIVSYGRQLGRVEGALVVLLKHLRPAAALLPEDIRTTSDLTSVLAAIVPGRAKHSPTAPISLAATPTYAMISPAAAP